MNAVFGILLIWLLPTTVLAITPTQLLIETSPSASLMHNLVLRSEIALTHDWRWTGQLMHSKFGSNQARELSTSDALDLGIQFYPDIFETHGPFLGIGLRAQSTLENHQRLRARRTYFNPPDNSAHDSWATEHNSASMLQTFGYRLSLQQFLTSSVGFSVAEKVHSKIQYKALNILPGDTPTKADEPAVSMSFFLNLGFVVP